jgi:hypothetical protein
MKIKDEKMSQFQK